MDFEAEFGSLTFDDKKMKERLPQNVYHSLRKTINEGRTLDLTVANVVADAMKNWAIENGCTHYTHWFQPLNGVTAEKHDSFLSFNKTGDLFMEFSGKELILGEPDASSFPSGGLRATFEARGYTAWDPTSYAFIKDNTLCIPTAFCSYGGAALDRKTPLLRSMDALNFQTLRILRLFDPNTDVACVRATIGAEQEYFLVDEEMYQKREDLIITGRTLFGSKPPKGQEMGDHYFGVIKPRVFSFMQELDRELWKLGIPAKTEHNETAPAQHELASIYMQANIATDHNQLIMEMMQKIARKHGLVCLLHEKPFTGVNGSGKHNNWSIATNTGINLLTPGKTPAENAQFLLFLVAVLQAVDDYQDLLRISVASAGNDYRLGGNEAPPAIISVFLGEELTDILCALERHEHYNPQKTGYLQLGADALPQLPKDTTDRNRTSPFAFTGNKFEFRAVGSSASIAACNTVLNTAVAESLRKFADYLEAAEDFTHALNHLIRKTIRAHGRIIFNGNGYGAEWLEEAKSRGLSILPSTPDALEHFLDEKNVNLYVRHGVYTETEMRSRYEIMLDNYCKTILIEASTMIDMVTKDIVPAIVSSLDAVCACAKDLAVVGFKASDALADRADKLRTNLDSVYRSLQDLSEKRETASRTEELMPKAKYICNVIVPTMNDLRAFCDESESLCGREDWPYPSYSDLLFGVR